MGLGPQRPTTGPGLTPAKVLGAAAIAGGAAAAAYAWSKRDSEDLRAAMQGRPISDGRNRKPGLIENLLAERRRARCAGRGDALVESAPTQCGAGAFAQIFASRDGRSVFKVSEERDLAAAKREFRIHTAAFKAGVPTAEPLAFHPRTGVIRMERISGRTGQDLFGDSFDASRQPDYGLQLSASMRTMHRAGISHNDLHPGNWIATAKGIRLIDWGLGSRNKFDLLAELQDSALYFSPGVSFTPAGNTRKSHPALNGYAELVKNTLVDLDWIQPRTAAWRRAIDAHYDSLDKMLRQASNAI